MQSYNTDPKIHERINVHADIIAGIGNILNDDTYVDAEVIPGNSVIVQQNKGRILNGLDIIVGPINEQNTLNPYDPITKLQIALENNQNIERDIALDAKIKILQIHKDLTHPYYKNLGLPTFGFKRTRKSVKKSTKRTRKSPKMSMKRSGRSIKRKSTKRTRKSPKMSMKRSGRSIKRKSTKRTRK